jgi:uncharacterized PurR-regulated membrane protein YhhQ (DUF165 family)
MGALILASSGISYLLNSATGMIAIASFMAFALAMLADTLAYHFLKEKPWFIRSNGSNLAGSAVDSITFPTIAFGGLMPEIVALQFVTKALGGAVWAYVIEKNINQGDKHEN